MSANRWKQIMVVVSDPFAHEQPAASKAAAVARRCGAKLVLFNAFMIPQPVPEAPLDSRDAILASVIRQRRERLEQLAAQLKLSAGTQCIVHWDYPIHEAIVRQVLQSKPDLLIAESHRHGRLARIVLANTEERSLKWAGSCRLCTRTKHLRPPCPGR